MSEAEVRYRAELAGAGQLLGTAVRSAGLALEHVAAQARLRAELADLAASRRRIIEDADDAAEEQAETYRAARRIVSTALADLRDLARGIHPAALTDDGLMTGLRTLANRSPVPLTIGGTGSSEIISQLLRRGRERNPLDTLTDREREILSFMAQGYSNDSICNQLFISRRTVESHVSSVFAKLGIVESPESSRRVLAVLAYLQG